MLENIFDTSKDINLELDGSSVFFILSVSSIEFLTENFGVNLVFSLIILFSLTATFLKGVFVYETTGLDHKVWGLLGFYQLKNIYQDL